MQIKKKGFGYAICEGMGITREVDTLLVGDQPVDTWVLVFLNSAREILSADNAKKITDAVKAIDLIMETESGISTNGLSDNSIEALFADLVDREPPKPLSLIALEEDRAKNTQKERQELLVEKPASGKSEQKKPEPEKI